MIDRQIMQFYFLYCISLTLGHYVNKCSICSSVKPIDSYICQHMCCNIKQHHKACSESIQARTPTTTPSLLGKKPRYNHPPHHSGQGTYYYLPRYQSYDTQSTTLITQARTHTTTPSFFRILTRLLLMGTLSHPIMKVNISIFYLAY